MILKKTVIFYFFCCVHVSHPNTAPMFAYMKTKDVSPAKISKSIHISSFSNKFKELCKEPIVQAVMPLVLIYSGIKTYKYSFVLGCLLGKVWRRCGHEFGNLLRMSGIRLPWFGNQSTAEQFQDGLYEGPECCICSYALRPSQRATLHPCEHNDFHPACIRRWLNQSGTDQTCPVCRAQVDWMN